MSIPKNVEGAFLKCLHRWCAVMILDIDLESQKESLAALKAGCDNDVFIKSCLEEEAIPKEVVGRGKAN